jgi:hypothetical protein
LVTQLATAAATLRSQRCAGVAASAEAAERPRRRTTMVRDRIEMGYAGIQSPVKP